MINTVVLMGRLTANPELKTTQSKVAVTSFSVACDRSYQKNSEERKADFINCVAWRNTAEFITKYFKKGQMIAVNGRLQQSSYTDKEGNKRTTYDVVVDNASFCGDKKAVVDIQRDDSDNMDDDGLPYEYDMGDDDLPF